MSSDITETGHHRGTAVVTGAARGLGRTFALALAETGHDLALLDLTEADQTRAEIEALGRRCVVMAGDASDPDAVRAFGESVRSRLPAVRVLVNNAGISPYSPFTETSLETWQRIMRVNLDSMFLLSQEFLPDLAGSGCGRIINLTSTVVWDAQARNMTAYTTSKAGIVGFTRALAGEVGRDGITVNCIAPGIVLTPDIQERVADAQLEIYRHRQAVPQLARTEDLVSALLFLADERSGLVTGTVVPVNGGRVIL